MHVTYEDESQKLISDEIVLYGKQEGYGISSNENECEIINDIVDIYPMSCTSFLVEVYNLSQAKYQLKSVSFECGFLSQKYESKDLPACDSDFLFDVKTSQETPNRVHVINNRDVFTLDLENPATATDTIELYPETAESKPMKISSDSSLIDPNQFAVGLNSNVFIVDTHQKAIINKIDKAHYNGVLSCGYDPIRPFVLCTTGMDYSIKFWDMRKPSSPVGGIYHNTHWIWNAKYNRNYSNMMITCSSSSIVRGIIFDKEPDECSDEIHSSETQMKGYVFVDYIEFEDSVYALDWFRNDNWSFAAVSYNSYFHVNTIPEDIKYKVML